MFKFTVSSTQFNSLLKRLLSLSNGERTATVSFIVDDERLEIFYNSKLDKTDSVSLFHEDIEVVSTTGTGQASLALHHLFTVKVPEFSGDEKYPQCREITFKFTQSILEVSFEILWNKNHTGNVTSLKYALLDKAEDLEIYQKLFGDYSSKYFEMDSFMLSESIGMCNYIKSDVTSKSANGCLLTVTNIPQEDGSSAANFVLVNTDSDTAVKFECGLMSNSSKDFSVVLAPPVLNAIKNFIPEEGLVRIASNKSQAFIGTDTRRMLVPVMAADYLISDPENFFKIESPHISTLDLKPLITLGNALVAKMSDSFKRLHLEFKGTNLGLRSNADKTDKVPATVVAEADVYVNGSFLLTAAQRLLPLGLHADLYYDSENSRLTLASQDRKLVFLIQGLSM